jgi:phosphopantothenoylcysteine decarboxylase
MPSFGSPSGNVLYLVVCAAPPAATASSLIVRGAQDAGWEIVVVATPTAVAWLPDDLEMVTGHPIRIETRGPDEPKVDPLGDAVLVAPATFNTINKWAAGLNDTLALGLLNESLGRDVPVAVVPWLNSALRAHPVYAHNLARLSDAGVRIADPVDAELGPESFAALALEELAQAKAHFRR